MKVYGVTGWKNTGKTGLVTRLVTEFTARGLVVSTAKHAHHGFDVDHEGRDSFRHREAGAAEVAVVSAKRMAVMTEFRGQEEPDLEAVLARLGACDLVLIEGWKSGTHPKIEAHRAAAGRDLLAPGNPSIRAVASDSQLALDCPVLPLDATGVIADFIARDLGL